MASQMKEVVQHLRTIMLRQDGAGLTDGQLLERFIEQRDEAAVAALVRRHGPMVWGVCRRVLRDHHDAEDAFQATFLVLVRKATSIVSREMVGNWLYGVAHRTALKARAMLAKRRTRERQVTAMPEATVEQHELWHDLQPVLDQELSRLPDKYRIAIVLCDLEGQTRAAAARHLGVPPGTLAARLTRGRALLAKRLARHGLAVSGAMLAAVFAEKEAAACPVMASTIKAVTSVAAGQAAATGMISAPVAALTEGVMKTMLLAKLKIATAVVLVLTVSAGGLFYQTRAAGRPEDTPRAERKDEKDLREAAIKAVEQFGKSGQAADREAALKALVDFRNDLRAAEEARRRLPNLTDRFKFRIPVEIGVSEFKEGGHIEILEVWGTRSRIEVGGQYLVHGKYTLPPDERGTLYFYETATGAWGSGPIANMDLQYITLDKQKGEFTIMHGMAGPGYFHLVLAHPERYSRMFANVYFGTGDNVLRKKSW